VVINATAKEEAGAAIAAGIGELLLAAARLATPLSPEVMKQNLRGCIDDVARGSKSASCRATDMSFDLVSHWLSANGRMRLDLLIHVRDSAGASVVEIGELGERQATSGRLSLLERQQRTLADTA
jgi:hypothetical protein